MTMPRAALAIASLCGVLLIGAVPLFAQKGTIEDLCRLHGIGSDESIQRIKSAFLDAEKSGISDDELYPFVEDILKHKLDCGQMVRVLAATTKLRLVGLPYFVIFSKVREGVAKEAPPALVVEAAESKSKTLTEARDVLKSLGSKGYRVRDFQNAAVIVSSYIDRGYTADEIVRLIRKKGIEGAGFAALSGVLEQPVKRKER